MNFNQVRDNINLALRDTEVKTLLCKLCDVSRSFHKSSEKYVNLFFLSV